MRDTRNSLFLNDTINQMSQLSFQRPLLVLLDRSFDLATPLHHTWTYQALVHDLFNMKLNRIDLGISTTNPATGAVIRENKGYDLSTVDKFWKQQKGNPFPTVAESIQEELKRYTQCDMELKSLKKSFVSPQTEKSIG